MWMAAVRVQVLRARESFPRPVSGRDAASAAARLGSLGGPPDPSARATGAQGQLPLTTFSLPSAALALA